MIRPPTRPDPLRVEQGDRLYSALVIAGMLLILAVAAVQVFAR